MDLREHRGARGPLLPPGAPGLLREGAGLFHRPPGPRGATRQLRGDHGADTDLDPKGLRLRRPLGSRSPRGPGPVYAGSGLGPRFGGGTRARV